MVAANENAKAGRIVVVVGVDLTDITEKLIATAKDLIRSALDAEMHIVHVVAPESLTMRLEEPLGSVGIANRANIESAQFLLSQLPDHLLRSPNLRVVVHTPVGDAARELVRIAREVAADVIVVEAHQHKRRLPLHRSLLGRLARSAPCSVLAVRRRVARGSTAPAQAQPAA